MQVSVLLPILRTSPSDWRQPGAAWFKKTLRSFASSRLSGKNRPQILKGTKGRKALTF